MLSGCFSTLGTEDADESEASEEEAHVVLDDGALRDRFRAEKVKKSSWELSDGKRSVHN